MSLAVYRSDGKGAKEIVGICDDWAEVGPMIYGDRDGIDWEATYIVEPDKEADDGR